MLLKLTKIEQVQTFEKQVPEFVQTFDVTAVVIELRNLMLVVEQTLRSQYNQTIRRQSNKK
jgi:hypothetical protein